MLKIYCQECGRATEYTLSKPLFCSLCGHSFTSIPKTPEIQAKKTIQKEPPPQKEIQVNKRSKIIERYLQNKAKKEANDIQAEVVDDEDDIEDITEIPNIENLDIDFIGTPVQSVRLGDILRANEGKTPPPKMRGRRGKAGKNISKVDKNAVWAQFAKEAGKSERIELGNDES